MHSPTSCFQTRRHTVTLLYSIPPNCGRDQLKVNIFHIDGTSVTVKGRWASSPLRAVIWSRSISVASSFSGWPSSFISVTHTSRAYIPIKTSLFAITILRVAVRTSIPVAQAITTRRVPRYQKEVIFGETTNTTSHLILNKKRRRGEKED